MSDQSDEIYGRAWEDAHIGGYVIERMFESIKYLLKDNRWQRVGKGFEHPDDFMASLKFDNVRMLAHQRKDLIRLIKAAMPEVTQRAIAETLGVGRGTVHRDLAPFGAKHEDGTREGAGDSAPFGAKGTNLAVHFSTETDEWETPQKLYDVLNAEFHFTLDVCATPENAKCERFFAKDGLDEMWTGSCWMNPPYGDEIGDWIEKAYESSKIGATVVCLVPARVDTAWWWDYCRFGEVRFIRGRLKFGGAEHSAPFPSVVVVFPRKPQVIWWEGWNAK